MSKVIEMGSRLEKWTTVYTKPEFKVQISSHFRLLINDNGVGDFSQLLSFSETMKMLENIKKAFDELLSRPL